MSFEGLHCHSNYFPSLSTSSGLALAQAYNSQCTLIAPGTLKNDCWSLSTVSEQFNGQINGCEHRNPMSLEKENTGSQIIYAESGQLTITPVKKNKSLREDKTQCIGYDYSFGNHHTEEFATFGNSIIMSHQSTQCGEEKGIYDLAQGPFHKQAESEERFKKEEFAGAADRKKSKRLVFSTMDKDEICFKISKKLFTDELQFKRNSLGILSLKEFEPDLRKKVKQF